MAPTSLPLLLLAVLFCSVTRAADTAPLPVWSDEFDGAAGSVPDPSRWTYDLGATGWGNNELQRYTDRAENASVIADQEATDGKALRIQALKTETGEFTSARLKTLGKFEATGGRIEARLKTTNGKGIWPAFWMLGTSLLSVGWPECGEIDVVEVINANPDTVHGTLHGPGYSGQKGLTGTKKITAGTLDQAYHVYAIEWSPKRIVWYFDGEIYHEVTADNLPPGGKWVFDSTPFYLLLNLAVGGNWPGYPDATTTFPQSFMIDYVRVYPLHAENSQQQ
jgi:beta-glucanase (GH16 family)